MPVQGGFTQAVLEDTNNVLNAILRPLLTSLPAFILGVFLMLQFHIAPFLGLRRGPLLRTLGQGLIVLQLYSDPEMKSKYPFVLSCFLVFLDQVVMQNVVMRYLEAVDIEAPLPFGLTFSTAKMKQALHDENKADQDEDSIKVVKNKYMDPSVESRRIALLFIGQLGLMCYFIYTLNDDDDSHDINKINFVKWSLALILTMCVDDDEAGAAYVKSYWVPDRDVFNESELPEICLPEHEIAKRLADKDRELFCCMTIKHKTDWAFRRIMDALINVLFRTTIMATAPMLLCTEEPIDFIKDCLALFFISKLDDLDDSRKLDEALKECEKQASVLAMSKGDKWAEPLLGNE
eukprot:TRINITY_DN63393_c0_g1_i1.p1 TRINITY_DN63393_c0_g1~~TRINITY_DN63393_c0_g1_i1.p1  ORF type:complete len:348 (-),score=71.62 TRINITY_DN63393_c0_g1_i1:157-1200(-)